MEKVILVFDIGKTNKKILLFNSTMQLVYQHEEKFETINDDDGFECDDIAKIEDWIKSTVKQLAYNDNYDLKGINFSTYGATLMYINNKGEALTPAYNYLKPMPNNVTKGFYESYGGIKEFSRKTASPVLGMLNSGLQALWLKKEKNTVYEQVSTILHLPQYLSFILTGNICSEYTSIGCHTALWDFDNMTYHQWLKDEELPLPEPVANSTLIPITMGSKKIMCGIGIHDSSASLAPYILKSREEFVLISTGTWCINMNPFNAEALTMDQLEKDCLSYMSISQKPVKSSRLFMGHIHDVNTKRLTEHFKVSDDAYKKAGCNTKLISTLKGTYKQRVFFNAGVPEAYLDETVDLNQFGSFEEAYHQLILDLTSIEKDTLDLVLTQNSNTKSIYISGGFARNEIFVREMASLYPEMNIYTSEIDNATALGAALVVWDAMNEPLPDFDLGLKYWTKF